MAPPGVTSFTETITHSPGAPPWVVRLLSVGPGNPRGLRESPGNFRQRPVKFFVTQKHKPREVVELDGGSDVNV